MRQWGRGWSIRLAAVACAAILYGSTAIAQSCVGDCPPPNQQVGVNELILGVNISLGSSDLSTCPSFDSNGNSVVGVEELIAAVNNSLDGCPGAPTATPRPSSPSPTGASLPTSTVTWTPAPGPHILFFGVTNADNSLTEPIVTEPIPIYARLSGSGFYLVVEADGRVGAASTTFNEGGGPPDLEIQVTRDLGNGSAAVCDIEPPNIGGVPGIDPPQLENPSAAALNDFGCRFIDGQGIPRGRNCGEACIRYDDGEFHCRDENTRAQFCSLISTEIAFPDGDTLVTVRVRDGVGLIGPPAQLIIRVTGVAAP